MNTVKNIVCSHLMMKILSIVCAVAVIALGLTEVVMTFTGHALPRQLSYVFYGLCAVNGMFLMMNASKRI